MSPCWNLHNLVMCSLAQSRAIQTRQEDKDKLGFVMIMPKAFIFVQLKFHLKIA